MAITELIPTVKGLSHADKLLLLQVLVQELVEANELTDNQQIDSPSDHLDTLPVLDEIDSSEEIESSLTEDEEDALALAERYAFLKKPIEERRRILSEQAEAMQSHYEQNTEWKELMAGDIVEY